MKTYLAEIILSMQETYLDGISLNIRLVSTFRLVLANNESEARTKCYNLYFYNAVINQIIIHPVIE